MLPSQNPEVDRQSEDRCHRIGQTKPVRDAPHAALSTECDAGLMGAGRTSQVTVYKLITEGTVDESIYKVQSAKRERTEALLGKDDQHGG